MGEPLTTVRDLLVGDILGSLGVRYQTDEWVRHFTELFDRWHRIPDLVTALRAQLATHATTIDRLSDANSVLAKEADGLRARLKEAMEMHRQCAESHGSTFGADWSNWKAAEARVRRLEEALATLILCAGNTLGLSEDAPGATRRIEKTQIALNSARAALTPVKPQT